VLAAQQGVASVALGGRLGLSARAKATAVATGEFALEAGVLVLAGSPPTYHRRAMAAALAAGVTAISHGAAARLHGLDGFDRYTPVDVIAGCGANPRVSRGVVVHRTRGLTTADVTNVAAVPVTTIATTLSLLAPAAGIGPTARALDSALRIGMPIEELRGVAERWRRRGRSGPPALLMLLGERVERRLPRSWFQRLAARVLARAGIRMLDEYPVRDRRGVLLAELDLADPARKVGVECQSWRWHATPAAQHRDARRRGALRQLGWEIVDVWWSDLQHPDRVVAEVLYLLRSRSNRPSQPA
jgi:hypothetical protein